MTLTRDLLADLTYLLRAQPGLTVSELVPRLCVSGAPVAAAEVKQRLVTNPHQFRREGESNARGYLRPAGHDERSLARRARVLSGPGRHFGPNDPPAQICAYLNDYQRP